MAADLDAPAELSLAAVLRGLHDSIDRLLECDFSGASSAELVDVLGTVERAVRRLPGVRAMLVAEVAARGLAAQRGCRSTAALLRQALRCSAGEAGSWLGLAMDLAPGRLVSSGEQLPAVLPTLAAAVAAGEVSAEQVRLIQHTMARIPAGVDAPTRAAAEEQLVAQARVLDPAQLSRVAARLLACLDPDGAFGSTDAARQARRGLTIGKQDRDGMYPVSGLLDPETGALTPTGSQVPLVNVVCTQFAPSIG